MMTMSDPCASPTSLRIPSTPTTPSRPPRSLRRASTHSNLTSLSVPDLIYTPPSQSSQSSSSLTSSPVTPAVPSRRAIEHRKSSNSIRRKPVPRSLDHLDLVVPSLPSFAHPAESPSSTSFIANNATTTRTSESLSLEPPSYILPVDPPSYPSYTYSSDSMIIHVTLPLDDRRDTRTSQAYVMDMGEGRGSRSVEELPRYTEEKETEPKTLARSLWIWGWVCPLIWAVGMCILWIPLKATEEEADAEKAQKLEEMIVILRETELKYAKRCLYALMGFVTLLVVVIGLAVILPRVI